MKKSEMFSIVVDKVCEICEVKRSCVINGSKMQSVVDARILGVQYLRRIGLSNDDIALFILREISGDKELCPNMKDLKAKARSVNKMFRSYSDRCIDSYSFCLMSADIKSFCIDKYGEHYLSWMKAMPMK